MLHPAKARGRARDLPHVTTTKLHPPHLHSSLLDRERLLEALRAGRKRKLTLVCAPPGYGKTTLLAQWETADRERTPFAWVTLDERDSDPTRLWSHVLGGLHLVSDQVGEASLAALVGAPNATNAIADSVIPLLVDELERTPPLVLVLEDWHAVGSPICDATMSQFVERAPAKHQIVVSSRADPLWPIARLRAHGSLAEVRARDLRVSPEEAMSLVREAGLRLTKRDVSLLIERTEGWLAGLSLALLALKEQEDPAGFVRAFSGDSHHVFDYLADDVLAGVAPETRDFMVRTSVLDRFSAALCDHVLERSGSAAVIAEIDRENLFLVALDETGSEYRYHQLFAAVLARELETTAPLDVAALHARASAWYEQQGELERAIEHAIASRDSSRASALVVNAAVSLVSTGRLSTLTRWFDLLSWPEALADRELAVARALSARLRGLGRDVVEQWLAVAEIGPDYGPLANGITSISSAVAMVRSAYLSRGIAEAERAARLVLEIEPSDGKWRYAGLVPLGQALFLLGRTDEAREAFDEARRLPGANRRATTILALAYLSLIELADGHTDDAGRLAGRALEVAAAIRQSATPAAGNAHLAAGCALMGGADMRSALGHLERAVELTSTETGSYWHAHALIRLAGALRRAGEGAAARDALARARSELDVLPDVGMLGDLLRDADDALARQPRRDGLRGEELTAAETRVLARLLDGRSMAEVAHDLWLSPNTVKTHRRAIYRKLGVTTREELRARTHELELRPLESRGSPR